MATTLTKQPFEITGGPGKYDWTVAFFTGKKVTFNTDWFETTKVTVTLRSVEWESGDGHSWNFKGNAYTGSRSNVVASGYYSTKTRTGWLTIEYR